MNDSAFRTPSSSPTSLLDRRRSATTAVGLLGAILIGLGTFPALQAVDWMLGLVPVGATIVRVDTDVTLGAATSATQRIRLVVARDTEGHRSSDHL